MKKVFACILTAAMLLCAPPLAGRTSVELPEPDLCGLFRFARAA